ncbi:MAG: hypothetical protein QXJ86_03640 [Nitrososphaerales archaeon]
MQLKLGDILPRLIPTYRSIDLRCAIGFHENEWINLSTVIRFTNQSIYEVENIHSNQAKLFPTIKTPRIAIVCKALPISTWRTLKEQISFGHITLNGLGFKISALDIDSLPSIVAKNPRHIVSEGWNITEASSPNYTSTPLERYESDLMKLGYPTTYNALNIWLQTKITTPLVPELVVAAPIYAKILRNERRTEKTLRIVVEKRRTLKNLNIVVEVLRESVEQAGFQETLQLHSIPLEAQKEVAIIDLRLPAALNADQIRTSLISVKPNPITLDWSEVSLQKQSKHPLMPKNPLLTLFAKLRDISHIQDDLQKDERVQVDTFYNAVIWMLSLCGFSVIYLGDRAKKRRGYIRHIEVIGADQLSNSIILGLKPTSENQIEKCVEVLEKIRDAMSDEVGAETQITPIIFYRRIASEATKRMSVSRGIILLDSLDLNRIIDLLKNDNIREARRRLGAPTPSRSLS